MVNKSEFAKFIKEKRTAQQLTQEQFAETLFVSPTAVSKWERGITYPDITLIAQICKTLDISEHEFITACDDTQTRSRERDANYYRKLRKIALWAAHIVFAIPLVICLIMAIYNIYYFIDRGTRAFSIRSLFILDFVSMLAAMMAAYSVVCLPFLLRNKTRKQKLQICIGAAGLSALLWMAYVLMNGRPDGLSLGVQIILYAAMLPYGIWAACMFTKHPLAFSLMYVGAYIGGVIAAVFHVFVIVMGRSMPWTSDHRFAVVAMIVGAFLLAGIIVYAAKRAVVRRQ